MKQNRTRGSQTNRRTTRTNTRQAVQSHAANHAANRTVTQEIAVPVAEAARLLGVDARTVRRMCAEGRLQSFVTPGGHRRVALGDIEAIQNGDADLKRFSAGHFPSPTVQQKKEHIEELHLTIQERKARMALQELEDQERQRTEQEEGERRAEEQEARRMRREIDAERTRRDRERENADAEARAAQARREWEADWVRSMLRQLPPDVPAELKLEVAEIVREQLSYLCEMSGGHAEDIVEATLRVAADKALRPWRRSKEVSRAADEALNQLPLFAKGIWGQLSEWDLRAREQALCAIMALPEMATPEQMTAAARAAGTRVAQEYEHKEARAKAEREAEQSRARLDAEAEMHLIRVFSYLSELEADPNGWDFEGKRYEYSKRIKQEIKPDLIESLPLDFIAGRQRVDELVDDWLAAHWNSPDAP
jgi:excisionase family DNA binding protein